MNNFPNSQRIVITGVGLTAPNANNLPEFREALLNGKSGVTSMDMRYFGSAPAGLCSFDATKYQKRRDIRNGTRAGSIAIYCTGECMEDAGIDLANIDTSRVGVFLGLTEHGNVETENEIYEISKYDYDTSFWSHHHNPRTVANSPAGEVTVRFGIEGPHYTVGAACAAGNLGMVTGAQQLLLGEVDYAFAGGISESPRTFGIFAAFNSQNALARNDDPTKASR
ncbi:MAG: beta-ketoacyl-[acyl-carrier-protein] synthase family protein, partial [Lentisphaeria bacterium]|nr:beta-ketoacyl-[acyl-carrier-protein] synthase family protein [Lentisphaeria bacterium]